MEFLLNKKKINIQQHINPKPITETPSDPPLQTKIQSNASSDETQENIQEIEEEEIKKTLCLVC